MVEWLIDLNEKRTERRRFPMPLNVTIDSHSGTAGEFKLGCERFPERFAGTAKCRPVGSAAGAVRRVVK
jgi:hypothetical protein